MGHALDIAGQRFGRLLIMKRVMVRGAKNVMWMCRCDCGGSVVAAASNIKSGITQSCGCLARESAANLLRGNTTQRTHHKSQTLEYNSWGSMKQRCCNPRCPKYPNYGGRGIKICDRWLHSFENFLADMGPKPSRLYTLHRIDNDGNYESSNCEWATSMVQAQYTTRSVYAEIEGTKLCISEWCRVLGVPRSKVTEMTRVRYGKPPKCKTIQEAIRRVYYQVRAGVASGPVLSAPQP